MLDDLGKVGMGADKIVDQAPRCEARDLAIELVDLLSRGAGALGHALHGLLQSPAELFDIRADAALLLLGELLELFGLHDFALALGCKGNPGRRLHDRDVAGIGLALHGFEGLSLLTPEGVFDHLPSHAVIVALERGRKRRMNVLDELVDVRPELPSAARRKAQRIRTLWIVEIGDVAPIAGARLGGGRALQVLVREAMPARALRPEQKDVVAFARHPKGEIHGLNGALLADEFGDIGKLCGGREAEAVRRAMPVELRG